MENTRAATNVVATPTREEGPRALHKRQLPYGGGPRLDYLRRDNQIVTLCHADNF